MSHYKLDVSTWRCGNPAFPPSYIGKGDTFMLNDEGYMCCLGQFAKQKNVSDEHLLKKSTPMGVDIKYDPAFCLSDRNTRLSRILMDINDCILTTPKEKVISIQKELENYGHTLTVINEHLLGE